MDPGANDSVDVEIRKGRLKLGPAASNFARQGQIRLRRAKKKTGGALGRRLIFCTPLARIIHGFWKTCKELASFAERFQSDCQKLKFVQAATTGGCGFSDRAG